MLEKKAIGTADHDLALPQEVPADEEVRIVIHDADLVGGDFRVLLEPVDNADLLAADRAELDARVLMEMLVVESTGDQPIVRVGPPDDIQPSRTHDDFGAGDLGGPVEERHDDRIASPRNPGRRRDLLIEIYTGGDQPVRIRDIVNIHEYRFHGLILEKPAINTLFMCQFDI
ncbi:MAG: hypothetical protein RBS99_13370 [Rhodospirillales bacterium]|nr:hypothetical protein [Rhodospirillales bacterium]